jgi:hypothetical protein
MLLILSGVALAAEVVWLDEALPDEAVLGRVAAAAGATGPVLRPLDLRAAATRWTSADEDAIRKVEAALLAVRAYEARLDGELVILRDLDGPLYGVSLLRNVRDRDILFGALAYQGFAADRFFAESLATDTAAEPWRATLNGTAIERPWADAVALNPEREITAYDIAEAPQRVAFSAVRDEVRRALPASLTPKDLPAGALLRVDGSEAEIGPAGNMKVVPGRHLVSAEIDGAVVARWDVRLAPGENVDAAVPLTDDEWNGFLAGLADGAAVPDDIAPLVAALGGEVWIARMSDGDPVVFAVRADGVSAVALPDPERERRPASGGASVALGLGGVWTYSGDFYTQDPIDVPHTVGSVNAAGAALTLGADVDASVLRFGVGAWSTYQFGTDHVALSGTRSWRVRPYLYGRAGLRWVQVSGGYLLPYHPAVGLHAQLPLSGPLEIQADGLLGLPGSRERTNGPVWDRGLLTSAGLSLAARL